MGFAVIGYACLVRQNSENTADRMGGVGIGWGRQKVGVMSLHADVFI